MFRFQTLEMKTSIPDKGHAVRSRLLLRLPTSGLPTSGLARVGEEINHQFSNYPVTFSEVVGRMESSNLMS